tara:strand:- start:15883 stop:17289 length:1407 start_codon:yes stop_codon:yes gene_type:complete
LGIDRYPADALWRQSLAQAFFIDRVILRDDSVDLMVSKNYQGIDEALALLADQDPDTCCAALSTLDDILKLNPSNGLAIPLDLIVAHIHSVVLNAVDAEVKSKAQAVLANALTNDSYRSAFFSLVPEEQVMTTLTKLESQCLTGPPSNMQSGLHLFGFFLDLAYHAYPAQQHTTLVTLARYIRLLRMTIIDTNPFDMRFAAVQSLAAIQHIWAARTTSKATAPLILGLSFVLYDLLNDDDDDEIRDTAALATGALLRAQDKPDTKDTVPLLTAQHLATWLSRTFSTSRFLVAEALRRLTNTPAPTPLFSVPFEKILARERQEDTALFATEKQNLYKDDTLDAVLWMRVLTALPASSIAPGTRVDTKTYILHALDVLARTAERERDGALGWLSKPEVFTLGIRVLCAAEVCLKWGDGEGRGEVLVALRRFADVAEKGEVHGLLLERVELVLEREVVGMMGRVAEILRAG